MYVNSRALALKHILKFMRQPMQACVVFNSKNCDVILHVDNVINNTHMYMYVYSLYLWIFMSSDMIR